MNNSELVDFEIIRLFGNHCGNYFLPTMQGVSIGCAEIDDGEMYS